MSQHISDIPDVHDDVTELSTTRSSDSSASLVGRQLSVALTWVRRGIPVIPCGRSDKAAMAPGFGKAATPEQLARFGDPAWVERAWSTKYARSHVGLLTGRSTISGRGLVVVDLDMPKAGAAPLEGRWAGCAGGTDVLELLMREAGADWPDTYTVMTPSGGLHLYYQQPEDGDLIGCATGAGQKAPYDMPLVGPHLGPMVDVRGIGGYVIAAGSYSAVQGRPYVRESAPELLPQPLPGWLLALLRRPAPAAIARPARPRVLPTGDRAERYAAAALEGAAADLASLREGDHRRDKTFAAAARLAELSATAPHILTEAVVREQLLAAALASGIKGGDRQAEKCITNGWERGLRGGSMGGAA